MKPFYLLLLTLLPALVAAQENTTGTQTVRGRVTDLQSGYQMPGVAVTLTTGESFMGASTDENGEFKITGVPVGRHSFKFSMLGYVERSVSNILVNQGKEVYLNVKLEESTITGEEVVITEGGDKSEAKNEMAAVSTRQFSPDETSRYAGSRNDPARMATNFAGVSGANDARNDIIIRGNSPLGLLWRLEGMPIPNPNHFAAAGTTGGPVSILNNNLLSNSDFMTGAFPAEYGDAVSGVFDLEMRNGNNEKREYLGQIGFNGIELGAEGPFSSKYRGSYLVNYRYSTLGAFQALSIPIGTGSAVPEYQDLSFKLNLPTQKHGVFSIYGLGGISAITLNDSDIDTTKSSENLYGNNGYDLTAGSNTGVIGINHLYFFNSSTYSKVGVMVSGTQNIVSQDSLNLNGPGKGDDFEANRTQTRIVLKASINKKFNARNTLTTGYYGHIIGFNFKEEFYDEGLNGWRDVVNSKGSTLLTEAYTQWQHRFNDRITLNTGVHLQHLALNQSTAIEPRAGMKWRIHDGGSINVGLGMHHKMHPVGIYFTETRLNDGSYVKTNKNLDFMRSNQAVVGYDRNLGNNWRIKTEVYYQQLLNVPVEQRSSYYSVLNAGTDFGIPDVDSLVNNGSGYNYGAEFTLEKFYSQGYYLLFTTSLFESKYKGSDGVERNTAFNGNYVINALGGKEFDLKKGYTFVADIKFTAAGGRRFIPIDMEKSRDLRRTEYDFTNPYASQFDPYLRLDVKVGFRKESKRVTHEFNIDVQNVTNRQNVFNQTYGRINGDLVTNYQLGILPIPQYRILF